MLSRRTWQRVVRYTASLKPLASVCTTTHDFDPSGLTIRPYVRTRSVPFVVRGFNYHTGGPLSPDPVVTPEWVCIAPDIPAATTSVSPVTVPVVWMLPV